SPSAGGGSAIPCPIPPGTATGTSPSSVGGSAGSGSTGNGAIAYPIRAPYRIEVSAQTELMLRDRSVASLSDFSNGDQINVFGYYNTDGSIQAYIVRDISKPVETETMQLNNVTLVSVSGTNLPATLAVTQTVGAPCYGFNGSVKSNIACPMGVSSFSQNSATADVQPPPSVAPMWMMLRKYVVTVDARTIILDSNRNIIPLSSLNVNDSLNVYGESTDNGQTITADIVRDTSIPVAQTSFGGTVTQVNSDGSFVIQTKDGQTLTIASPVSVGESVSVTGIQSQGTITQITRLTVSTSTPNPVPGPLPMMRIQGSSYPTSSNGKPINY
ncbi:MAG TPA: DUF5666 domain-containing protein, partial [Candidatus Paceibacterota bacterium]|nr:DUF5666 domain-containing protein [Candidatus Paceibacterota bacterium]